MKIELLNKLALIISAISSPFIVTALVPMLIIYLKSTDNAVLLSTLWIIFSSILPALFVLVMVKIGKISDLHIMMREQRSMPYIFATASALLLVLIYQYLSASTVAKAFAWILVIEGIIFYFLTLKWKVSVHTAALVGSITALGVLLDSMWYWLFLSVPLVIWARLYRKRHTLNQTLVATIITIALTLFVFKLSNLT